jgi:hypothetical protein
MRNVFLTSCCFFLIISSCSQQEITSPQKSSDEYIIISGGNEGFIVKNIQTAKSKSVPAVLELGGRMYLPIFSSLPTFNKKVVGGLFVPDTNYYLNLRDTIFHVTKHLRDTTVATVGIQSLSR